MVLLKKKTDCNTKIAEIEGKTPDISNLATQTVLVTVENKIPSMNKYFKLITNTLSVLLWQSKGLSTENIDPPTISLSRSITYVGNKIRANLLEAL